LRPTIDANAELAKGRDGRASHVALHDGVHAGRSEWVRPPRTRASDFDWDMEGPAGSPDLFGVPSNRLPVSHDLA